MVDSGELTLDKPSKKVFEIDDDDVAVERSQSIY
jgi:hypothetical protein